MVNKDFISRYLAQYMSDMELKILKVMEVLYGVDNKYSILTVIFKRANQPMQRDTRNTLLVNTLN